MILVNAGVWTAAWTAYVEWLIEEGAHRGFLFGADLTADPQIGPLLAFLR